MIAKHIITRIAYYNKDKGQVRVPTLLGLALAVGDTFKSIYWGWRDCEEALYDWREMLQLDAGGPEDAEAFKLFHINPLFTSLGRPMENADDYLTPWDDYLELQRHSSEIEIVLRGWGL